MRSDVEVQRDVEAELRWVPHVDEAGLAVKVSGGVITLLGSARSSHEKYQAERAVRHVKGVTAIANELEVCPPGGPPNDAEIAQAATAALRVELPTEAENLQVIVHQGHVALLGSLEWHYQRDLAEALVRRLSGVLSVRNSIKVQPKARVENDVKQQIEAAFERLALLDAGHVLVEAAGSEITLRGEVRSWAERDQAEATAWCARGVTNVRNEISVRT